jgi:hypothetical protein
VVDDLVAIVAARAAADPTSPALQTAQEGADVLESWDRRMDADSRGSLLFTAFSNAAYGGFANAWDLNDPLNTPNTLADPDAAVTALVNAVNYERGRGRELDMPFGDANILVEGVRPNFEFGAGFPDMPTAEGLGACILQNECLATGVDSLVDCVLPGLGNPNPACAEYIEIVPVLACVPNCGDDIVCAIACLVDNIIVSNPFGKFLYRPSFCPSFLPFPSFRFRPSVSVLPFPSFRSLPSVPFLSSFLPFPSFRFIPSFSFLYSSLPSFLL